MISDKFRVSLPGLWDKPWPGYFENFWEDCTETARINGWDPITVVNYRLRPLGGRLITTKTQGWYLRWDQESCHTAFVLRWA